MVYRVLIRKDKKFTPRCIKMKFIGSSPVAQDLVLLWRRSQQHAVQGRSLDRELPHVLGAAKKFF